MGNERGGICLGPDLGKALSSQGRGGCSREQRAGCGDSDPHSGIKPSHQTLSHDHHVAALLFHMRDCEPYSPLNEGAGRDRPQDSIWLL